MNDEIAELFLLFPHEAGIILLKTLEIGALSSCCMVLHCVYVLIRHFPAQPRSLLDTLLLLAGALRVLLFLPRPHFWLRMHAQYRAARYQRTPQLVARRLRRLHAAPLHGVERALAAFFYCWLGALLLLLWWGGLPPTPLSAAMGAHLRANVAVVLAVRVVGAALFLWLQQQDFRRGIPSDVLAAYTTAGAYAGAAGVECAICYEEFAQGAAVRTLWCRHAYHAACVDQWLLEKQNKCPLCQRVVGPEEEAEEDEAEEKEGSGGGGGARACASAIRQGLSTPLITPRAQARGQQRWRRGHTRSCAAFERP